MQSASAAAGPSTREKRETLWKKSAKGSSIEKPTPQAETTRKLIGKCTEKEKADR